MPSRGKTPCRAKRPLETPRVGITVNVATEADIPALMELRNAAAAALSARHGKGFWSRCATARGIALDLRTSTVLVARSGGTVVATLRLTKRKPWAIDRRYFSTGRRPVYLAAMAVHPRHQHRGIGRQCLEAARAQAKLMGADAIFLDAFDAPAGAGGFYCRCGFREVGRTTFRRVPLIYYELLV